MSMDMSGQCQDIMYSVKISQCLFEIFVIWPNL